MNVVIIPLIVADEIEDCRRCNVGNAELISDVLREDIGGRSVDILRSIPFDTLLSALVNGYVREKTEAERHAELKTIFDEKLAKYNHEYAFGMITTLDILGITIAGINDNQTEVSANV